MPAESKLIEVRDDGTTMVCIALKPMPRDEAERWGWARTGYGVEAEDQRRYVLLAPLAGGEGKLVCDPFKHPGSPRTMPTAHRYIIDNWNVLRSGDVVDVEYILGETKTPKTSERIHMYETG